MKKQTKHSALVALLCGTAACLILPFAFKTEEKKAYALEIDGVAYQQTYGAGYTLALSGATARVGVVEVQTTAVLKKDGEELARAEDGEAVEYSLTQNGEYELVQYAFYGGKYYAKSYFFTVDNQPFFDFSKIKTNYSLGETLDLNVTAYIGGNAFDADVTLSSSVGEVAVGGEYTFASLGEYELTASVEEGAQTYTQSAKLTVSSQTYADLFQVTSGGGTVTANYDLPEGKRQAGNGVYFDCSSGTVYSFANVVDVNLLNKNIPLIEWAPVLNDEYQGISHFYIRMTDKYDADNVVAVDFFSHWDSSLGYVHINRGPIAYGLDINGNPASSYNTPIEYSGTMLARYKENYHNQGWTKCGYEPTEKAFYVESNQALTPILDLDNTKHVGVNNVWDGFTTGEVYVELEIHGYAKNGIVVSKFFGQDFSGSEIVDETAPSLTVENENGKLPLGFTGEAYAVPQPLGVNDLIEGVVSSDKVEVQISRKDGVKYVDYSDKIQNGAFTPDVDGEYRVVYFYSDSQGNETLSIYTFEVQSKGTPEAVMELPETLSVGAYFALPEVTAKGLSKLVSSSVEYLYNGVAVEKNAKEQVLLDKSGSFTVKYRFVDYTGNVLTGEKSATCVVSDKAVLRVVGVPYTAIKGQTLVLPDFEAYDYRYEKGEAGFTPARTVKVNGTTLGKDLSYEVTENAGSKLTVEFIAGGSTETKYVEVIEPKYISDYFKATAQKTGTAEGVQFTLTETSSHVQTVNPMYVADDNGFEIKFSVNGEAKGTVTFYMTAFYNDSKTLKFSVNLERNSFTLNDEPTEYPISRVDGVITILYRDSQKQFTSVVAVKNFLNGTAFDTLENMAYFSFETSGFKTGDTLTLRSLGGMSLAQVFTDGVPNEYQDNTKPTLIYQSGELISGSVLTVPSAKAWKFFAGMTQVTVTVYSPEGDRLISNQRATQSYEIALSSYGNYSVEYKMSYGKSAVTKVSLVAEYIDETPITYEFSKAFASAMTVGDSLKMPEVNVLTAQNTTYYFTVTNAYGVSYILQSGESVNLTVVGTYKVTFVVFNDHQMKTETFTITVSKK